MDMFTKEELQIIQRALISMGGILASVNKVGEYKRVSELGDKVRSNIAAMDMIGEENETEV